MPYVVPTADQFTTRFPIFADQDEALITMLLNEASTQVDESWREVDYQPAIMYLAAHLLATDNSGEGQEVEFGDAPGAVVSESFAGMSTSYGSSGGASGGSSVPSKYSQTVYGRRYWDLLKSNKPAIMVI